jgi:hypothetical protein
MSDKIVKFEDLPEHVAKELQAFVAGRSCPREGVWTIDYQEWLRTKGSTSSSGQLDPVKDFPPRKNDD